MEPCGTPKLTPFLEDSSIVCYILLSVTEITLEPIQGGPSYTIVMQFLQ